MKSEGNWAQKNRVIGKAKPYRGLTRMRADQEEIAKIAEIERQKSHHGGTETRRRSGIRKLTADERGSEEVAGIAVIARHRRHRKNKTLPRMNADKRGSGKAKIGTTE